ncbi:MAG TPA: hypothetical protein VHE83_09285 [Mycobacteriales bacterium]|nr:hypothetical protein [Mycobacteriales bacterium]
MTAVLAGACAASASGAALATTAGRSGPLRSVRVADANPSVGAPTAVSGRLSDSGTHVVLVETTRNHRWRVRATLHARRTFSTSLRFRKPGAVRLRVVVTATRDTAAETSAVVSITVVSAAGSDPGSSSPPEAQPGADAAPLAALNAYRTDVGVAPVGESYARDAADAAAARCLIASGQSSALHVLDTALCPAGTDAASASAAAASSVVMAPDAPATFALALSRFEALPFHALALATPSLATVGFGYASNPVTGRAAALVDVTSGLGSQGAVRHPMTSPPSGWTVPGRLSRGAEWPDPLAGCPSVGAVSGPAVWVATGVVGDEAAVGPALLEQQTAAGWLAVPTTWCTLRAASYDGGSADATDRGRFWLRALGAVALIPSAPLPPGSWRVRTSASGQPVTIAFTTT